MVRRAGQAHSIDALMPHRTPGSLHVRCPSCAEIGVNVDIVFLESLPKDQLYAFFYVVFLYADSIFCSHRYTVYLSADGNMKCIRMARDKKSNPDDVSLTDGYCIFPNDILYTRYLKTVGDSPDV